MHGTVCLHNVIHFLWHYNGEFSSRYNFIFYHILSCNAKYRIGAIYNMCELIIS